MRRARDIALAAALALACLAPAAPTPAATLNPAAAQAPAGSQTPRISAPRGFVNDDAGALSPETRRRIELLLQELQQKTGAEVAVLVVNSTAPLDDFDYAMAVAEAWKPGKREEDTGLLVLLALKDRKLRVLTGYGLEGILPDGLVGEIQDREMIPALRQGNVDEALWRGVAEYARRIADARGVQLTGLPERRAGGGQEIPLVPLLIVIVMIVVLMRYGPSFGGRGGPPIFLPGGGRGGSFPGGFGGGGGGFGGFGGGGFGGGGAGRSW